MAQSWLKTPVESQIMTVKAEWLDYNGHLNMAYYNVLFDLACDEIFARCGLGEDYAKERNASYFTAEAHVCYLRELEAGMPVVAKLQLLDLDAKRIRFYQELYHAEEGWLSATSEQLCLHIDMNARKTAPWPDDIYAELDSMLSAHKNLGLPERAGRSIAIRRKSQ
ncbi:thioesterase family protein [Roseibium sp.]|uniref:thioesterase family protein n=1 Tax=Roseibium sp. TaxID=1936156 RepID=UPI003A986ACD